MLNTFVCQLLTKKKKQLTIYLFVCIEAFQSNGFGATSNNAASLNQGSGPFGQMVRFEYTQTFVGI